MNIVNPERWRALKNKVYYETAMDGNEMDGDEKITLKLYKINEDIKLDENSIYFLMDELMVRDEVTKGFVILEKESLILNSFKDKGRDLYSNFYSIEKDGLTKTFDNVKNFGFKGIRAEIVNHEKRAWDKYLHTGEKLSYLDDIFTN